MAKPKLYDYSPDQLQDMLNQYFQELNNDPSRRGGPSDLLSYIHMDMVTARVICGTNSDKTETPEEYKKLRPILTEAATRLRAHMETSSAWASCNSSKAIFILKQPLWDGIAYQDKQEITNSGKQQVEIVFGSGKEAEKAFD